MRKLYFWTAVVVLTFGLYGVVTPWMVNQDSFLTLGLLPFLWLSFAVGIGKAHVKLFDTTKTEQDQ